MGGAAGALADPVTKQTLVRSAAAGLAIFVAALVLLLLGWGRIQSAEDRQDDLERRGDQVDAIVISVDDLAFGVQRATIAYGPDGDRRRAELIVVGDYEARRPVPAYVDPDDPAAVVLPGELPQTGWGWALTLGLLAAGVLGVGLGVARLLRSSKAFAILRGHTWTHSTLHATYPRRGQASVSIGDDDTERLVKVGGSDARRLAKHGRKAEVYVAGSGRRVVISPASGARLLAPGRMDEALDRLTLLSDGARPDRFAPDDEVSEPRLEDQVF